MINQNTALAPQSKGQLITRFASRFGVDPAQVFSILKQTAFRQADGREISNEQMAALLIVADQYGLNPFTREIYAYPDKNGAVVPVVGVDGWNRIANDHPQFDGLEFAWSDEIVEMDGAKPCPAWVEVKVFRKDRGRPIVIREYLDEVYRPPFKKKDKQTGREYTIDGPWQGYTKRMLRNKGLNQAIRVAMGFSGIHDEDEAESIANTMSVDVDFKALAAPEPVEDLFRDLVDRMNSFDIPVDPAALEKFCQESADFNQMGVEDLYKQAIENLVMFRQGFQEWLKPKPPQKPPKQQAKPKPAPAPEPEPTPPPNTTEESPPPDPEDDGLGPWKTPVAFVNRIRASKFDPKKIVPCFVNWCGANGWDTPMMLQAACETSLNLNPAAFVDQVAEWERFK